MPYGNGLPKDKDGKDAIDRMEDYMNTPMCDLCGSLYIKTPGKPREYTPYCDCPKKKGKGKNAQD